MGQEVRDEIGHKNGKEIWQENEQKVGQKIGHKSDKKLVMKSNMK